MGLQRDQSINVIIQRFAYLRNIIEMSAAQNFTSECNFREFFQGPVELDLEQ